MHPSIRSRLVALVRGQWAGLLALFLVIAGGTAYAADTVFSTDIVDGEVKSVDIGNNQVLTADVRNEKLTGVDIKDQSGVDTCTHGTVRLGEVCVRALNADNAWLNAALACQALELRLPSLGEGLSIGANYDIPGVGNESFWTEESVGDPSGVLSVWVTDDAGAPGGPVSEVASLETLCVTTPTN